MKSSLRQPVSAFGKGMHLTFLGIAAALLFLMPSSQSLWVDESIVALIARQPDFGTFWHNFWNYKTTLWPAAEALKPFCSWNAWFWAQGFGTGEWQLRFPNIFWLFSGLLCLWRLGLKWNLPHLPLVFSLFPFVWYCADEVRPYAIQLGTGCWLLFFLVEAMERKGEGARWVWGMMLASWIMSAASMLGIFSSGAAWIVVVIVAIRQKWIFRKEWILPFGAGFLAHAALGAFYLAALHHLQGGGGAKQWDIGAKNILFCFYEIFGFSGLGPGRTILREAAQGGGGWVVEFLKEYGAGLFGLIFAYVGLAVIAMGKKSKAREWFLIATLFAVPFIALLFLTGSAWVAGWPFWGRHASPIVPFVVAGCVLLIGRPDSVFKKAVLGLWILMLAISSFNLRFNPKQWKDNNRGAAQLAAEALQDHRRVWWVADEMSAAYYYLPGKRDKDAQGEVVFTTGSEFDKMAGAPVPDIVILCKPDIYDGGNRVLEYLKAGKYEQFGKSRSFTYWKKPSLSDIKYRLRED